MSATITKLVATFGEKPGISPLLDAGWRDISGETFIAAKPEYTTGTNRYDKSWHEGFSELLDGRIVYRGYYGNVLLAPPEYQPAVVADEATKQALYRKEMGLEEEPIAQETTKTDVWAARTAVLAAAEKCPHGTNKDKWLPYVRAALTFWTLKERHCSELDATAGAFQATEQRLVFEQEFTALTNRNFDFESDKITLQEVWNLPSA